MFTTLSTPFCNFLESPPEWTVATIPVAHCEPVDIKKPDSMVRFCGILLCVELPDLASLLPMATIKQIIRAHGRTGDNRGRFTPEGRGCLFD